MAELMFWVVTAFAYGACFGSFSGVVIDRVPEGRSVNGRSACAACGSPIPAWHNLPIVSWPLLRGTAACCGAAIPRRVWAIEVAVASLWALSTLTAGQAGWAAAKGMGVALAVNVAVVALLVAKRQRDLADAGGEQASHAAPERVTGASYGEGAGKEG
jgi:prepilin signal peptidase PulO-like enzyme (type II secretory pathway)